MSTLGDLLAEHTMLPGAAVDHLHAVVGEWQLLADMSFGDYLMWVRRADGAVVCVAQCRPNTAATLLVTDAVGTVTADAELADPVPVRYRGEVVALLTHQTSGRPASSRLEQAYLDCAGDLLQMLSEGTFPNVGDIATSRSSPRVGDGFIRLDVDGVVSYASPNALSAYHRMGLSADLEGHNLVAITRPLISDPFERQELSTHIGESLAGGPSMRVEVDAGGAAVLIRTLPLVVRGAPVGAAVLIRDVTEVKRRDRALLSKDATIREIHHRVKNNLQTISSLLRLQARRLTNPEAKAAVQESVRRIRTIALVHESLSREPGEDIAFIEIVRPLLRLAEEGLQSPDRPVRFTVSGDGGRIPANTATPLSVVLTELLQNAVDHGFPEGSGGGEVQVVLSQVDRTLTIRVVDNGRGVDPAFDIDHAKGLGLSIVRTLVTTELNGTIGIRPASPDDLVGAGLGDGYNRQHGTVIELRVPTDD